MVSLWTMALLLLVSGSHGAAAAALSGAQEAKTVRDVYNLMYRDQRREGGAYLLLNATGSIGSSGPRDADSDAPLIHLGDFLAAAAAGAGGAGAGAGAPEGEWVVLVPVAESNAFLSRLAGDEQLQARVKGVLVDDTDVPPSYSTLPAFPGAEYAPYPPGGYVWNPSGAGSQSGAAFGRWPAPVMHLTEGLAKDARERADYNREQGHRGCRYHARIRLPMSAAAEGNASACLAARKCLPLGGFSVWAALPPLPAGTNITKPTLLVVAQVDSIDLFHDSIQGAGAPLSGLAAMLAAASLLGGAGAGAGYTRQIVFLALAGEPWGYMGSRALLWELQRRGASVAGLDFGMVDQVLEIGPVGRSLLGAASPAQLYAHTQRGDGFGDASAVVEALQAAAAGLPAELQAAVSPASSSNPGVPPSSLMSFLRVKPSVQGAVLAEFDRAYSNPYQGSRFDDAARAGADAGAGGIAVAASVVAAAAHSLAGGAPGAFKVNATEAQEAAAAFAACLILPDPGMSCPLASGLMAPGYTEVDGVRSYAPKHYVGVLRAVDPDPQSPFLKDDVPRFIWNSLARSTAGGAAAPRGVPCDPVKNKCPDGQACVGWKRGDSDPSLLGACLNATARYVPAVSTRLSCEGCDDPYNSFKWVESGDADGWSGEHGWPRDPMWMESDWPLGVPFLQLYLLKPYSTRVAVLVAGILVTAATLVASLAARRAFERHVKTQ